jgi:hypothetical protein
MLGGVILVENVLMASMGLLFGVGLGAALGVLVQGMVSASSEGASTGGAVSGSAQPSVLVIVPWGQIGALAAAVGGLLAVVALVVIVAQPRQGLGAALRAGEER